MKSTLVLTLSFFGLTALAQEKSLDNLVTNTEQTVTATIAANVTVTAEPSTEESGAKTLITKAERQTIGRLNNVYKIDEGIYRSEQPDKNDFIALEKMGLAEVLNVRRFWTDDRKARNTDLTLHHISMKAGDIEESKVIEALKIISNRKGPLLIHCWHGSDRTGMLIAMYRLIFQNWTKDAAIEEMTKGDFGFHSVYGNIIEFVRDADVENIREQVVGTREALTVTAARLQ
jgi:protein tyrosine/serine phosphatase